LPDELLARLKPLLEERSTHPLGCHDRWIPDRSAIDAIFFDLRAGCRWQALTGTAICMPSLACL
jgi:transposase